MTLISRSTPTLLARLTIVLTLLGTALAFSASPASAADRDFAPRFTANDTGDIDIVGNTVMTCNASVSGCLAARSAAASATANSAVNNNAFSMVYVDTDSDATTFNSSSSTVSVPTGATILFAGLYWGGEVAAGSGGAAAPNAAARNTVKFRAPGDATYSTITATTVDDGAIIYQGFADVTSRVSAAGNGVYTAANIQTATGGDRLGGWSLVIAYRDTSQPARNLTVFDGLKSISSAGGGTISVSGFQTPPAGAVNATVGFVTYEGDLGLVGDGASLNGIALSDPQHPATNFFSSRSSRNGVLRTGNNPSYDNNLGFEQSMLKVGNSYIANGATSATIGLTTAGDVYAPGVITVATDLYAPKIDQTKSVVDLNGGLLEQGDTVRYTISGTNTGQDGATGFVLRDAIPADTTYKPGTIKLTQPGGASISRTDAIGDDVAEYDATNNRIVARLGSGSSATAGGTIGVNQSYAVSFDAVVNGPAPAVANGTTITNTATASFNSASLGTALTATSSAQIGVSGPDLAVTKSHTGPLVVGDNTTYTLGVKNVGPASSQGQVKVSDTLPSGLAFISASGNGWTCAESARTVTCTRSDALPPTNSYPPISLVVAVTDAAPATVANTVTLTGGGDGLFGNNSAVDSAPTQAITDLALTKTADTPSVAVGSPVTYSLKVTNKGPSPSTGSTVVDTIPAGMVFVSASPNCISDSGASTVTCSIVALASGASSTVTIATKPSIGTAGSTLTNRAVVSAHENDPTPGNNTALASVDVKPVDLQITNSIQGNPAVLDAGSSYTWLLDASNIGTSPAADTTIRFVIPDGLTVSPTGLDPRCALTGNQVVCTVGTLAAGASVPTIEIIGTVTGGAAAPGSVDTTAMITSSEPEDNLQNNTATTDTPVANGVDLAVALASDPTSVGAGDTLALTATVTNAGPGTPLNPVVVIDVPAGTTFVSADAGCTFDAATARVTCVLTAADLEPGESLDRTIVVTVGDDPVGPLTSSATVTTTSNDVDLSNNTAPLAVPVLANAGLSIIKTADVAQAAPGSTVTYTLRASNAGPANARDVIVTDQLPAGVTLVSTSGGTCSTVAANVSCDLGTLAAGASRTVTLAVSVDPIAATTSGASHQVDVTKTESHLSVPANTTGTTTTSCPAGFSATDGSVRIDAVDQGTGTFADLEVLASGATADGDGWTGTVRNGTRGQAQAKVNVVCLSDRTNTVDGHSHSTLISDPITSSATLTAGSWPTDLSCGPGRVAVAPSHAITSGAGVVRTSERDGDGWSFVIDVPESAEVAFSIQCLSTSLSATNGHTHDVALQQLTDTVVVPAGATVERQLTCGDLEKGIVASTDLDQGLVSLGNDPQPKTRVFRFFNPTSGPLTARIGLLCLNVQTSSEVAVRDITNTASVSTSVTDRTTSDDTSSATFRATASTGPSGTTAPAPVPTPAPVPAPAPPTGSPSADPRPSVTAAKRASVVRGAKRTAVKVGLEASDDARVTIKVLGTKRVKGTPVRRGSVLAKRTTAVDAGTQRVRVTVRKKVAKAVRGKRVRRAEVVLIVRDASGVQRSTQVIRLR